MTGMENHISQQLFLFLGALLLGAVFGLAYDLLRAVHRKFSRALVVCDLLFCAVVAAGLIGYTMHSAGGELRLYLALGSVLGAAAYFSTVSAALRPLWDFWMDFLLAFCRICAIPAIFLQKNLKKMKVRLKKHFHFWMKWVKIVNYKWEFVLIRRRRERNQSMRHQQAKQNKKGFGMTGILVKLVIIAIVIYAGVTLYTLQHQISEANAEEAALTEQIEQVQDQNNALRSDIAAADQQEKLEEVARDELGMVKSGEKVFYDTNY